MTSFEFPGKYYEIIRRAFRDLESETDFLLSYLPAGGRVLDIGCGTGTNLRRLAACGHECVGIDQSTEFVDFARRQGDDVSYIHSRAVDARPEGTFDLISCLFVTLNYMPFEDVEPMLAGVASWLRPNGHFVLDMAHLLNFVEDYRPYVVAHHEDGEVLITRLTRHSIQPHAAVWRHDETMIVQDAGSTRMFRNSFEQIVLTVPEVEKTLDRCGLRVVDRFGDFRKSPPSAAGRGHLILVAKRRGDG